MLSTTQTLIIRYMESANKPLSITQIAAGIDIHIQTARNHVMTLKEKGLIEVAAKDGKANLYSPALATVKDSARISWNGQITPMSHLLAAWAEMGVPKSAMGKAISQHIINLYIQALKSAENEGAISILFLRDIRGNLISLLNSLKQNAATLEGLINNDKLWMPNELPMELILKETEFSPLQMKQMIETIKEDNK